MKKGFKLLMFLLALIPFFTQISLAEADTIDQVELILHKRLYRDIRAPVERKPFYAGDGLVITEGDYKGNKDAEELIEKTSPLNGAQFTIYDATDFYHQEQALGNPDVIQEVTDWNPKEIPDLIKKHGFEALANGQITTQTEAEFGSGIARIKLPCTNEDKAAAYLILETGLDPDKALNVDLEQRSSPMLLVLPQYHPTMGTALEQIHLYPKNIGYVRDPYFFKYGKNQATGEEQPLKGVVFAFYQLGEKGEKLYLDASPVSDLKNKWRASANPLSDPNINKFVSDETGLVNIPKNFFASGTYYFEELQTASGYKITAADQKIEVVIPDSWKDAQGNFRYVTVNGQEMTEEYSGVVPESARERATPRIYNYLNKTQTTQKQPENTAKKQGILPKTGAAKAAISLFGIMLFLIGLGLLKKRSN